MTCTKKADCLVSLGHRFPANLNFHYVVVSNIIEDTMVLGISLPKTLSRSPAVSWNINLTSWDLSACTVQEQ